MYINTYSKYTSVFLALLERNKNKKCKQRSSVVKDASKNSQRSSAIGYESCLYE